MTVFYKTKCCQPVTGICLDQVRLYQTCRLVDNSWAVLSKCSSSRLRDDLTTPECIISNRLYVCLWMQWMHNDRSYLCCEHRQKCLFQDAMMWSETVGLRTRMVWDKKYRSWSWSCTLVMCCEIRSCHAHHENDLEWHSNFSSTVYNFSILVLKHHYCGDQQWRSLI